MLSTGQYPGTNSNGFKNFLEKKYNDFYSNAPFLNGLNERLNQTLVNKDIYRCAINEIDNKCAWTTIAHKCVSEDTSVLSDELKKKDSNHLENDKEIAFENSMRNHDYNKKLYDKDSLLIRSHVSNYCLDIKTNIQDLSKHSSRVDFSSWASTCELMKTYAEDCSQLEYKPLAIIPEELFVGK
ncbi:hypothetical protein HHI36_002222, partial [Cryptolaemus montrouzieri]